MIPFFCGTASTVTVSSSRPGPGLPRLPDISPASAALFVFRRRQRSGQPVTTMIINRLNKLNAFVLGEGKAGKELGGGAFQEGHSKRLFNKNLVLRIANRGNYEVSVKQFEC